MVGNFGRSSGRNSGRDKQKAGTILRFRSRLLIENRTKGETKQLRSEAIAVAKQQFKPSVY
jgi:hypothetical protein